MRIFLTKHGINHNIFGRREPDQHGTVASEIVRDQTCDSGFDSCLLGLPAAVSVAAAQ